MTEQTRRSLGGRVVEAGLRAAGFSTDAAPGVTLVETAWPSRARFHTVLAQNAWNVCDRRLFTRLLRRYPLRARPTYVARRGVSRVNLRRADTVVTLSEAMADLTRPYARTVRVAPLTLPADVITPSAEPGDPLPPGTVLVPGTVAWHKNPLAALGLHEKLRQLVRVDRFLYAGADDGSGAWQAVEQAAAAANLPVTRATLGRADMLEACRTATAVVVPSHLESLSFSLGEGLALSTLVVASDLPVHREVARRLGREPLWISGEDLVEPAETLASPLARADDLSRFGAEWEALGRCLGLVRESRSLR